jgi:TonB family protein
MLDQLVISRNQTKERAKFSGFMLSTSIVMIMILMVGMVISLFSQNIALGAESLEISALLPPVPIEPEPKVVEEKVQHNDSQQNDRSKEPMRTQNVLRIEEVPLVVPKEVNVTPSNVVSRPFTPFEIGKQNYDPKSAGSNRVSTESNGIVVKNVEKVQSDSKVIEKEVDKTPPPIIVKKEEAPQKIISTGVVNGKAINLVTPSYSAAAKSLGLKGTVKIQVVIDEDGKVISATAISGHPLLTVNAVAAAKRSTFTPTTLSKQKVKVSGFIVYNFT